MAIFIIPQDLVYFVSTVRGRRIMANMSAFQANDASSILAARTKIRIRLHVGF